MKIVLYEINQIYSLRYRQIVTKEKTYIKSNFKGPSESQYSTVITDVLNREFPICDVPGGRFGKPLIFTKGNPPL